MASQGQAGGQRNRCPDIIDNGPPGFDFKTFADQLLNSEYGDEHFNMPGGKKPPRPPIGPAPGEAQNPLPVDPLPFVPPPVSITPPWRPSIIEEIMATAPAPYVSVVGRRIQNQTLGGATLTNNSPAYIPTTNHSPAYTPRARINNTPPHIPTTSSIPTYSLNGFSHSDYSPVHPTLRPRQLMPENNRDMAISPEHKNAFTAVEGKTIAPMEFMMMSFNRVYEATRLIWMERLRDMAAPILRAPNTLRIHEAHCFHLGSFAKVIWARWELEDDKPKDLAEWLITRLTQDKAIQVMTRYCIMLLFFEILTVNGATGVYHEPDNPWTTEGTGDRRWFCMYFNDPRLLEEDIFVLRRFCKKIQDQSLPAAAMVNFQVCPKNGYDQGPTNRTEGHQPGCHCTDKKWNHFVYVADGSYEGLAGPTACKMPSNPAVFLADDYPVEYKHNEGCHLLVDGKIVAHEEPHVVPKTNTDGNPCACGMAWTAMAIPQHLHMDNRYMKYCLHSHTKERPVCVTDLPRRRPATLPHGDALYIRKDLSPNARWLLDFQ